MEEWNKKAGRPLLLQETLNDFSETCRSTRETHFCSQLKSSRMYRQINENTDVHVNWNEGVQLAVFSYVYARQRDRKKFFLWWERAGRVPRKMVVWGLGRGECESLFIWSVTKKPSELDGKENLVKKLPN